MSPRAPTMQQRIEIRAALDSDAGGHAQEPRLLRGDRRRGDGDTQVEVTVTSHVEASMDGTVMALAPGGARPSAGAGRGAANRGRDADDVRRGTDRAVASIPAPGRPSARAPIARSADYDLTGSEVHADGKVAVISGHRSSFVPYHALGVRPPRRGALSAPGVGQGLHRGDHASRCARVPTSSRVHVGRRQQRIHFEPAAMNDLVLDRGEFRGVRVARRLPHHGQRGAARRAVSRRAGLRRRRLARGRWASAIPRFRWPCRPSSSVDSTACSPPRPFPSGFLNVVAHENSEVKLDGTAVTGFRPIRNTGMVTARVKVDPGPARARLHRLLRRRVLRLRHVHELHGPGRPRPRPNDVVE